MYKIIQHKFNDPGEISFDVVYDKRSARHINEMKRWVKSHKDLHNNPTYISDLDCPTLPPMLRISFYNLELATLFKLSF